MLQKSQIFSFLASFLITLVVGFLFWNIFVTPENNILSQVLGEANKIGFKIFSASVSLDYAIGDIILVPDSDEERLVEQDLSQEENFLYFDNVENEGLIIEVPQSLQDQLDDIQERLDVISQQVQELVEEQNSKDQLALEDEDKDEKIEDEKIEETISCMGQININTASRENLEKVTGVGPVTAQKIIEARPFYSLNDLLKVSGIGEKTLQKIIEQGCAYVEEDLSFTNPVSSGGGGGGSAPVAVKNILISEFQVEGEIVDDDYVELYNPNDDPVSLNGWSIKKASITGNISHVKNFTSGAKILGKNYFLIVNNNANQKLLDLAKDSGMTCSGLELSSELAGGNTIYLVGKKGVITDENDQDIIDEVGYGMAKNYKGLPALKPSAGKSAGRIWDETLQEYKNTNNNHADFEIDTPSPKEKNIKWVEPTLVSIAITTPATKLVYTVGDELDISGLVVTGTYSDSSAQAETITDANIAGFDGSALAIGQVLTITIDGQSATYTVDINSAPTLQSIAITTQANKLAYTVGDLLDITGLVVTGTYGDGSTKIETVTSADVTGFDNTTTGTQTLTVTVDGQIITYTVTVSPVVILPSITTYTLNGLARNVSFNPNNFEKVTIVINASESVKFNHIYICPISAVTCDNLSDIKYFTSTSYGLTITKEWLGNASSGGAIVPDGIYQIGVEITDEFNKETKINITLVLYTITVVTAML